MVMFLFLSSSLFFIVLSLLMIASFVFIISVVVLVVAIVFPIVQCYSLDKHVVIATKSVESDYRPLKEKVTSQLDEINKIIIGNLKK